jgi:hypothetical protein
MDIEEERDGINEIADITAERQILVRYLALSLGQGQGQVNLASWGLVGVANTSGQDMHGVHGAQIAHSRYS